MKFSILPRLTFHPKKCKIKKNAIGLCVTLSCAVFSPPCWGMQPALEEQQPFSLFQDLIPDTGESFKVIIDHVNQGDSQHRYLVKKWVYNLFVSPELLQSIKFDALLDIRDIRGMDDVDMYAVIRLLDEPTWKKGPWVESFTDRLKERAAIGNTAAQNNLGLYYRGNLGLGKERFGVEIDYQKGDECLIWSAKNKNPYAQRNIGLHHALGLGRPQDIDQAKQWLKRPAEEGHPIAQTELAGLVDDRIEALNLLSKAAQQGYYKAEFELGQCYRYGKGVVQNFDKAIFYSKKAAEQPHYPYQVTLGIIYFEFGRFYDAYEQLNLVLNNESINNPKEYLIYYYLGFLYDEGLGGAPKNGEKACQFYDSADQLFRKVIETMSLTISAADDNSHYFPHHIIAGYYEQGLYGIPRDTQKARYWYDEASGFGSSYAISKISELTEAKVECSELRRRAFSSLNEAKETDSLISKSDDHKKWHKGDESEEQEQEKCIIS